MNLLPFGNLPPHRPRRFVPEQIDLGNWEQIKPLFDKLEVEADQCVSVTDLERWILNWDELRAALDEESARRYIAMSCHTESKEAEGAYLHFVEKIDPELKPRNFTLEKIYLESPLRKQLDQTRFAVYDRSIKNHVELYREENVALETEEAKLGQQYQKLAGSLTVNFRGEEKTLIQMGRFLEEPDRALRQEAWELVAKRRLQEADKFEELFDGLIKLREQIAKNAGFGNYRDYAFKARERFDYGPEDCAKFHQAIEDHFIPAMKQLQAERKKQLGVEQLRPWDLSVDPFNRAALRPFEKVDQMVTNTQKIFDQIDAGLAAGFKQMRDLKLLDLENRKGKAPGGYQSTLNEARLPFIFMNAVGVQRDVETMLHEAGHAFHALATREQDIYAYRGAPIEFCEVASMSMELLGNEFLEEFYNETDANRARKTHLEGIIGIFPWIATVDAFQQWIYTHPGHTRAERKAAWLALMDRFGGSTEWSGYEDARAYMWHRQLHIFLYPFYYVEYGIAQLGALQVWANSKKNKAKALKDYQDALALGGSKPLPELFSAAGCRFQFDGPTVQPLAQLVTSELATMK
ncbi:MAG TPA: M3 family oligoendopeptidase [Verrucomicrobiae bacterium]